MLITSHNLLGYLWYSLGLTVVELENIDRYDLLGILVYHFILLKYFKF